MLHAATAKPAAAAVAAAATIAAGVAGALPASGSTSDHAAAAGRPTAVVARTVLSDTKAVLTTTRAGHLTATVRLTVYRRTAQGTWRSTGTQVVGKRHGWFWFVSSGPHAVCGFSVSNTPRRAVAVRLLITPSIGCATRTQHFHVEHGRLVSG